MLTKLKSIVHGSISAAGYSLVKDSAEAFPELRDVPRYQQCAVRLEGHDFKIADAVSFRHSYAEIFEQRIYEFETSKANPRIVDCGSNYGTSVVYFKTRYPDAVITAVECDPEIHKLLSWNLEQRNYAHVDILNKAVSTSSQPVTFSREGADAGRVGKVDGSRESIQVETILLDSLIDQPVDFLKMDIEGEEASVLCASDLRNVSAMFIEYHSFKDQPQSLSGLLAKLTDSGFRYYIQTQFCSLRPLIEKQDYLGMDLQLNLFAIRA